MPAEPKLEQYHNKISDLEKKQAVTDIKLDNINQSILEIKNNHLLHINDSLSKLSDQQTALVGNFNTKIGEIYSKISDLKISDARQEPGSNLFNKIIEYIILGVIGIAIAYFASK